MFATKRARGWALAIVGAFIVIAVVASNWWASSQAENEARSAETRLRVALGQTTIPDLLTTPLTALPHVGSIRTIQRDADGIAVTIGVNSMWQYRCVVGHLDTEGRVMTTRVHCGAPQ